MKNNPVCFKEEKIRFGIEIFLFKGDSSSTLVRFFNGNGNGNNMQNGNTRSATTTQTSQIQINQTKVR
jgi:hypothetical protein